MLKQTVFAIGIVTMGLGACASYAQETPAEKPGAQNLLRHALERAEGHEIIMDVVSAPANTTLPKHTHPGEEFIYVLEGSGVLWRKGEESIVLNKGDTAVISPGTVHTAITTTQPLKALVIRVHPIGEPVRELAE